MENERPPNVYKFVVVPETGAFVGKANVVFCTPSLLLAFTASFAVSQKLAKESAPAVSAKVDSSLKQS